ncbi:MAG: transposase, partial [Atopobiaceae bacterium]|nr:transposase [Atopobiaceae bacterium]
MSKDSKSFVSTAGMATVFGIDSHSRTTTICALSRESGETETRTFRGNDYAAMARWMSGFPAPTLGVYEAGCTGFVPARRLSAGNVSVVPIAPSKMPASSDSRTRKNDRNDAARLARLAVAGELKEVWVPPCEIEGMRELAHALDDLKARRARAFQHVLALLCRHGCVSSTSRFTKQHPFVSHVSVKILHARASPWHQSFLLLQLPAHERVFD